MKQIIKNQIQISIQTRYRENKQEWVAEADISYDELYTGHHRWTGKTELEATRALFADLGHTLLALEQTIKENQNEY